MIKPILVDLSTASTAVEITSQLPDLTTGAKLDIDSIQVTAAVGTPAEPGAAIRIEYRDSDGTSNPIVIFRTAGTKVDGGGVLRSYQLNGPHIPTGKRTYVVPSAATAAGLIIHGDIECRSY